MAKIEVRPAREEDRAAVLAFCAQTWEWGDYIEHVWDDWLHNPDGQLLVATADGQPVAITHLQMLSKDDAWLEGLRVNPDFRRQGLARAINEAALIEAMRRGATHARLAIESNNTASQQLSTSMHLHRVSAFSTYTAPPLDAPAKHAVREQTQLATTEDLDEIIHYLNVSNVFPLTGGLYYRGWRAYAITGELLEEKIAAQNIYLLRRWDRLDGLAIAEPVEGRQGSRLSLGYIDGTAIEAISLIAYDLRRRLSEMGLVQIVAYAPDLMLVHDAFSGNGYESDGDVFYIYERGLV